MPLRLIVGNTAAWLAFASWVTQWPATTGLAEAALRGVTIRVDGSMACSQLCVGIRGGLADGQSPIRSTKPAASVPRTPWGHPDLQGRWTNATLTPLERPAEVGGKEFFTEAEAAEYKKIALDVYSDRSASRRTTSSVPSSRTACGWTMSTILSVDADVADRRTDRAVPPFTPEAQKRAAARGGPRKADRKDGPEERTLAERCLWFSIGGPPMLPFVYNSNYEIVQTPTHVAIQSEQGGSFRTIPLDGRPHLHDTLRQWQGDSRGRWEGDTLVVETTNFTDKRDVRGSTDRLRVVERFRRPDRDTLLYEFTAEDPTTWTAPWIGGRADEEDGRTAVRERVPRGELRPGQHPPRGSFRRVAAPATVGRPARQ